MTLKCIADFNMIRQVCAAIGSDAHLDPGLISLKVEFTDEREIIVERKSCMVAPQIVGINTAKPQQPEPTNDKPDNQPA